MQAAFDAYADSYDEHFSFTETGKLQRLRTHKFLGALLQKDMRVLELNCGTGEDAIWMASQGAIVNATDISGGMVATARKKADHTQNRVVVHQCSTQEIAKLRLKKQQLVFSNFGGLNCLSPEDLKACAESLSALIESNGVFAVVVMGRKCMWERIYFRFKGRKADAVRRLSGKAITATLPEAEVKVWYYSPAEFVSAFSESFELLSCRPVGLFLPPSYLENYFRRKRFLLACLNLLERIFSFGVLSNYADHYFIVLKRKEIK